MADVDTEALARGAAQGATAGWGDEAVAKLLAAIGGPKDPEGYSRDYAAGSAEDDYLQSLRHADSAAASRSPWAYGLGEVAGSLPGAIGGTGAVSNAARGAGLLGRAAALSGAGAAQGALVGAGSADTGEKLRGAAAGGVLGGLTGLAGAEAEEVARALPTPGLVPGLMSRVNAPAEPVPVPAEPSAPRNAIVPGRPSTPPAAEVIPRAPRPLLRESLLPAADEYADAAYAANSQATLRGGARNLDPGVVDRYANAARKIDEAYPKPAPAKFDPEPASGVVKTVRPARVRKLRAAPEAEKLPAQQFLERKLQEPVQQELPGVPMYQYHATPMSNAAEIAKNGLSPEMGGRNFNFAKNRGRIYMSNESDAPMWAQKLRDFSGEEPLQLRTKLPAESVQGSNEAVRVRTRPVPPEALEARTPSGQWASLRDVLDRLGR